jgi:hypothetical protein
MHRDRLLRLALRLDGGVSGVAGLVVAVAAAALDGVLGIPAGWLVALGLCLVAWAAALGWLSTRPRIPAGPVWTVIAINVLWIAASVVAAMADWFPLTALGLTVVVGQALGVVVFADLEYVGLRRLTGAERVVHRLHDGQQLG